MDKQEFLSLVDKFLAGKASPEEEQLLLNFYASFQQEEEWDEALLGSKQLLEEKMLHRLQAAVARPKPKVVPFYARRIAAAVAILLVLAGAAYLWMHKARRERATENIASQIMPGSNKALLRLANGQEIILDSAHSGILVKQGHTVVTNGNGQLVYDAGNAENNHLVYNTISTPRGGQYRLVLPDGTKVWLNAASSLRFPAAFTGNERNVTLTGEAYFEVARNEQQPFKVAVDHMQVEVLGTDFNIMAYPDEGYHATTLVSGAVRVANNAHHVLLRPGEQACSAGNTDNIKVAQTDVEEVVAWKNGLFIFNNENIRSVMRKLARWYDVEVTFSGNMDNKDFEGVISRSKSIEEVLRMLELTGIIHFKIDKRRIIVMP